VSVSRAAEFEPAFAAISALRADAILLFTDSILFGGMAQMTGFSQKSRIPLFAEFRQFTEAGGLMSYGANLVRMARDSARHIDRILKGAKPADLPVERPTEFELVINQKTAAALGITIPQAVLLRADEVIR
jgi:putative tryptophan/tyrosine transport system substrate-binding protein